MGVYSRLCELLMVDGTLKVLTSTEPQPEGPCQKEDGSNKEEQKEEREDFAEMVSTYIISTDAQWNALLKKATIVDAKGAEAKEQPGVTAIEKKLEIAKRYYKETFNVDLDKVRDTVIERENNVVSGSYNLTNLNY